MTAREVHRNRVVALLLTDHWQIATQFNAIDKKGPAARRGKKAEVRQFSFFDRRDRILSNDL
jgi:hypothetical protein